MQEHFLILMLACGQTDLTTEQIRFQIEDTYWRNRTHYLCDVTIESVERTFNEEGNVALEIKHRYKANKDSFLLVSSLVAPQKPEYAKNNQVFLGRARGNYLIKPKDKEWIITGEKPADEDHRIAICRAEKGLSLPIAEWDLGNTALLGLKDLTIRGMSRVTWNGREAIRVDIHRSIRNGLETPMYFDPKTWVNLGSEVKSSSSDGGAGVIVVEYDPVSNDPTKWSNLTRRKDGTTHAIASTEITKFIHESHSDDEFSFTQFGLPEPEPRYAARSTFARNWLLWLFIGLVIVAIAIRQMRSRSQIATGS